MRNSSALSRRAQMRAAAIAMRLRASTAPIRISDFMFPPIVPERMQQPETEAGGAAERLWTARLAYPECS
jgi:hypothetical protein